jgi:hypothetical protein
MRTRHAVAAALLCLAVSGCTARHADAVPAGQVPSGGSPSAAQELAAALHVLTTTSYRYATSVPVSASQTAHSEGAVDPAAGTLTASATVPAARGEQSADVIVTGGDIYLRFPPGFALGGGHWLHVDRARLDLSRLGVQNATDPSGVADITAALTNVDRDGDRRYRGTLDLTKAPHFAAAAKLLGAQAGSVPFEAGTDDQHRLTTVTLRLTVGGKDVPQVTTFTDYGTKVDAGKPAGAVEAPESLYNAFGR